MPISNEAILRQLEKQVDEGMQRIERLHKTWLTQEEAKDYLGIKDDRTMKARRESGLPYSERYGRYYYKRDDLDAWLEAGKQAA